MAESSDPNAIALSQALEKENGVPWRIMHRVTYVSRVLPEIDGAPTTVEDKLKAINIESNYELIRRLEPYVRTKTDNYAEFSEADYASIAQAARHTAANVLFLFPNHIRTDFPLSKATIHLLCRQYL